MELKISKRSSKIQYKSNEFLSQFTKKDYPRVHIQIQIHEKNKAKQHEPHNLMVIVKSQLNFEMLT